jgi:heme/copper-type cytochrome/quinol oxidase subunit 2
MMGWQPTQLAEGIITIIIIIIITIIITITIIIIITHHEPEERARDAEDEKPEKGRQPDQSVDRDPEDHVRGIVLLRIPWGT